MNKSFIGLKLLNPQGEKIEVVSFFEKFNMYNCNQTTKNGNILTGQLLNEDDIQTLINRQEEIKGSEKHMQELKQKQQEEIIQEEKKESIGNFLYDQPLQHAKAKQVLNKSVKFNGKYTTRKEMIKELIEEGYTLRIIDKMLWNTRKVNLERKATYKYNVPVIEKGNEFYTITKTEYNYGVYLQNEIKTA